jgi:zinc protease
MMRAVLAFLFVMVAAPAWAAAPVTLDIGDKVQVWFQENHTVPMVAVTVALPAGSAYDPLHKEGLASFAAAMIDEGAGTLRSDAYHQALANKAIMLSVAPDRDYLVISLYTLKENLKDAMDLLGLALARPRMDPDAVTRVRGQIVQSLLQNGEDPETQASNRFFQLFFSAHPYAHPTDGTIEGVSAITPRDLKLFTATHWVKGGAKVTVAGDVDAKTLTPLLKSVFDPLPDHEPPPPSLVRKFGGPATASVAMAVPQSVIVFGLPGIRRADPDYLAGYVANHIVGNGDFSARLTNEVREKRGLTYSISTSFGDFREAGYIVGDVATKNGSVAETIGLIRSVLADYAANGPTAAELADAKTYLTGSFPLAFASNTGIANQLNSFQRDGLPIGYVARRNSLVEALTLDDVKRAAKRLFDPSHIVVVVAGPPNSAKPRGKPARS